MQAEVSPQNGGLLHHQVREREIEEDKTVEKQNEFFISAFTLKDKEIPVQRLFFMGNQGEVLTKTDISMQELLADHRKQNSCKSLEPFTYSEH